MNLKPNTIEVREHPSGGFRPKSQKVETSNIGPDPTLSVNPSVPDAHNWRISVFEKRLHDKLEHHGQLTRSLTIQQNQSPKYHKF